MHSWRSLCSWLTSPCKTGHVHLLCSKVSLDPLLTLNYSTLIAAMKFNSPLYSIQWQYNWHDTANNVVIPAAGIFIVNSYIYIFIGQVKSLFNIATLVIAIPSPQVCLSLHYKIADCSIHLQEQCMSYLSHWVQQQQHWATTCCMPCYSFSTRKSVSMADTLHSISICSSCTPTSAH